ncbi:MAG TPA: rRNA maturation RNase YbeY [Thermoanaerobaculia bacterium]|nr:rRNA maturation RNase YbeY [Thermoanaerobaculia bacterium]
MDTEASRGLPKGPSAGSRAVVPEVTLQNPCQYPEAGARKLRPWVDRLAAALAPGEGTFVVRFVSDREMRQLNRLYREKDQPTDVLSFPGEASPEGRHLGDVVISVPTARRQAREAGHGIGRELQILILHGLLHCLGYDHETDDGTMERLEAELRRTWIPREPPG